MFSFHKPRVYRSTEGCCICRAKSSSSRFTDSRKYEPESVKCFDLMEPRQGEICNACVLLVKRFKRLPAGSKKTWGHVVDARAGPGTKSLTKHKKRKDDNNEGSCSNNTAVKSSLLPEKFTKIFKKSTKATKQNNNAVAAEASWLCNSQSLPTTPDSLDSDVEDNNNKQHFDMPPPLSSVVEFQTQTRASAYRSRHSVTAKVTATGDVRTKSSKNFLQLRAGSVGSKRRKCLMPRKKYGTLIDNVKFFDETEWQQRKSCCGIVYERAGAIIIDIDEYSPCANHQRKTNTEKQKTQQQQQQDSHQTLVAHPAKVVSPCEMVHSVVQLSTAHGITSNHQPTPVLKKHHLFYRRQSESFPHGNNFKCNTNSYIKTDLSSSQAFNAVKNNNNNTFTTAIRSEANDASNISAFATVDSNNYALLNPPSSSCIPPMLGKSFANVPNINPPHKPSTTPTPPQNSYTNFLHKIKADTASKIIKHSIEKFNTAQMREVKEIKHVKSMDKSFVLAQPLQSASNTAQQNQHHHHALLQPYPLTITAGVSPIYSSSGSTKFSDNSSDSGFDENTLDRKSASPLQEDTEKKLLSRHGVQTMFLASSVQIQGQHQNIVLAGNEVAAKIQQNRMQQSGAVTGMQPNSLHKSKAEIVGTGITVGPTAHTKIRSIYTHNNSIQHENGITTILPASSFAATTQTAAMMNALSTPSTVTITPALLSGGKKAKVFITNKHSNLNLGTQQNVNNLVKMIKPDDDGGDPKYNIAINKNNNN